MLARQVMSATVHLLAKTKSPQLIKCWIGRTNLLTCPMRFVLIQGKRALELLESWVRRKLRCVVGATGSCPPRGPATCNLLRLGLNESTGLKTIPVFSHSLAQQVTFPVTRHRPIFNCDRTFADRCRVTNSAVILFLLSMMTRRRMARVRRKCSF
jgi:hypothetical protein